MEDFNPRRIVIPPAHPVNCSYDFDQRMTSTPQQFSTGAIQVSSKGVYENPAKKIPQGGSIIGGPRVTEVMGIVLLTLQKQCEKDLEFALSGTKFRERLDYGFLGNHSVEGVLYFSIPNNEYGGNFRDAESTCHEVFLGIDFADDCLTV